MWKCQVCQVLSKKREKRGRELQLLQQTTRNVAKQRVQTSPACDHTHTHRNRDEKGQRKPRTLHNITDSNFDSFSYGHTSALCEDIPKTSHIVNCNYRSQWGEEVFSSTFTRIEFQLKEDFFLFKKLLENDLNMCIKQYLSKCTLLFTIDRIFDTLMHSYIDN